MRSSVSAGSRTSQRMAFSQNRWKARPSSPSPAARKPQCQAVSVSSASARPLPASPTTSTGAGLPSAPLSVGWTSSVAALGLRARHPVDPLERRQLAPARFVLARIEQQRGHRVGAPLGRQPRLEEVGGEARRRCRPSSVGGAARQLDGQHVAQRR